MLNGDTSLPPRRCCGIGLLTREKEEVQSLILFFFFFLSFFFLFLVKDCLLDYLKIRIDEIITNKWQQDRVVQHRFKGDCKNVFYVVMISDRTQKERVQIIWKILL